MDRWILSFTNSLIKFVHREMDAYHLYAVVSPLSKYFETLTNCYIRLNRRRFKGAEVQTITGDEEEDDNDVAEEGGDLSAEIWEEEDRVQAISTLGQVLVLITRLMAPFTPFFAEYLWTNLKAIVGHHEQSVHFTLLPRVKEEFIDESVERRVAAMRTVIESGRMLRERKGLSVKVWSKYNIGN